MLRTVICMCSSGSGMCWTVVRMPFQVRRKLRTVVYTHIHTHIPCLPLYVCAVPGPVCAGPWYACTSGFSDSSGPWFYTHIPTHIPCLPLYVCAVPGPVCSGPWCACPSGFGESFGPWFIHIYIRVSLVHHSLYVCAVPGPVYMLDRGLQALPGSAKAPDRGLYTYTYVYPLCTGSAVCWTVACVDFRVR